MKRAKNRRSVPIKGYHADYAFVVKGLLDLYEANLDPHWLEFAEILQDIQDELFWDATNGGYFSTTKDDPTIILRLRDGTVKCIFLCNFSSSRLKPRGRANA